MNEQPFDFAILGSGLGGGILALVLSRIGYRVAVIDKSKHPRFAIGESSTPLADTILFRLCEKFDLPELKPLCRFGTAKQVPSINVGKKRGFSYFRHEKSQSFVPGKTNQLLVSASSSDEFSDSHFERSSVDQFVVHLFEKYGVAFFEGCEVKAFDQLTPESNQNWKISLESGERIHTRFAVDATGRHGALLNHLGVQRTTDGIRTHTRAVFGHFQDLAPWHDLFITVGGDTHHHPFRCDDAAIHHLLDAAWMWQLPFENGITSCGIVFDQTCEQSTKLSLEDLKAEEIWAKTLGTYPTLQIQFADAKRTAPQSLQKTERLQFVAEKMAGKSWLCLPGTAGFIDPLHSKGIAHTLSAVEKLSMIFADRYRFQSNHSTYDEEMSAYSNALRLEFAQFDRIISMAYRTMHCFEMFVAATIVYFATVTAIEQQIENSNPILLASDNKDLIDRIEACHLYLDQNLGNSTGFVQCVKDQMKAYDRIGLFESDHQNMFQCTAAPKR